MKLFSIWTAKMLQKFTLKQKSQIIREMCKDDLIYLISNKISLHFYDKTSITDYIMDFFFFKPNRLNFWKSRTEPISSRFGSVRFETEPVPSLFGTIFVDDFFPRINLNINNKINLIWNNYIEIQLFSQLIQIY